MNRVEELIAETKLKDLLNRKGKEVKKSFFLKVWWNHFVTFVNEKL